MKEAKTAFGRIDEIDRLRERIDKAYGKWTGRESFETQELRTISENIDELHEKWTAALFEAGGNFKNRAEVYEAVELSDATTRYSIREKDPPKKTGIAYKVFLAKDGQLFPPMVANPGGEGTPVGVWLDADAAPLGEPSKTGRLQVQAGGKGTNVGKTSLAYRPGWHLGDIPLAKQFAKLNPETGVKELFPSNFVWAECEYAMDVDYQDEAMSYGYTDNGKFRHSYAGLPKLPTDGYYRYRTNPNPDTVPWIITGAMRVNRILTDAETDAICRENGVEPMKRQGGEIDFEKLGITPGETKTVEKYSLKEDYDFGKPFSEQIDDLINGKFPVNDTLVMSGTPKVFQDIGLLALPMTYTQKHAREAIANKNGDHLGKDLLIKVPEALKNPIAIIDSSSVPGRIVAIIELQGHARNVLAAVEIDGKGVMQGNEIDSNTIVSVHSRDNAIKKLLSDAVISEVSGKGGIYYWNKKKAIHAANGIGVQFPGSSAIADGFIRSIHDPLSKVNPRLKNIFETKQFKRWFGKSKMVNEKC